MQIKSREQIKKIKKISNEGNREPKAKYEMDMCNGPILKKLLIFTLPLMCSSMLQLLFNAADIIVVG